MNNVKLEKGIYEKTGRDTYQDGKGTLLVLMMNEPDSFWLNRMPPLPDGGVGNGQTFKLIKTQNKDVFKIDGVEENLFLEIYKDRIEIKSEEDLILEV